ncbi:hypothetical protein AMECASPLE_012259 [Ameca splendens]|uniref:Uncharacterized protein n=1 Tax=Ameca splendens TaxID=208324 RepID=A0ABV0YCX4_9TELE
MWRSSSSTLTCLRHPTEKFWDLVPSAMIQVSFSSLSQVEHCGERFNALLDVYKRNFIRICFGIISIATDTETNRKKLEARKRDIEIRIKDVIKDRCDIKWAGPTKNSQL